MKQRLRSISEPIVAVKRKTTKFEKLVLTLLTIIEVLSMKYTYDTNRLKNAMIYALHKASKDAGLDRKDFKPITIDVKKLLVL